MSPGEPNYDSLWECAKGVINLGGLNIGWDLTEGRTKEQFIRDWRRQNDHYFEKLICLPTGRIIIPSLNIY